MTRERLKDIACILSVVVLFWVFFILDPPRDLGDIGMSLFSNDEILMKVHTIDKKPFIDVISQYGDIKKGGLALAYQLNNFAYPLGASLLHMIALTFGLSPFNGLFLEVICAFIAIMFSFFLGRLFRGRFFGLLFAILMCINIYFNVIMRTGASFIVMTVPLVLGAVYFFLKAHHVKSGRNWQRFISIIISSIFLALCYFNGYPISYPAGLFVILFFLFLIIVAILVKFKVIPKSFQEFRLISFWMYIACAVLSISLYFMLTLAWDRYNQAPDYTTYKTSISVNMGRYAGRPTNLEEIKDFAKMASDTLFVDMDKGGRFASGGIHSDTAFDGMAVIPPVLTLFFILGIIYILKKRRQSDLIMLIFFLATFAIFIFLFRPWATRVFVFTPPILLLVSSVGIVEALNWFWKKISLGKLKNACLFNAVRMAVLIVILLTMGRASYSLVHDEFMKNRAGHKIWSARQADLYESLRNDGINSLDLVIFAGSEDIYVWLTPIIVNGGKVESLFYHNVQPLHENFKGWLAGELKNHRRVYFVFLSEYCRMKRPGLNYSQFGIKTNYSSFLENNPNIQPLKVIYDSADIPMHYIYRLDKEAVSLRHLEIRSDKDEIIKVAIPKETYIKCLSVDGPAKAIVFKNGLNSQRIPLDSTKYMEMFLNFGGASYAEFTPNFESQKDAFVNVLTTEYYGRSSVNLAEGRGGFNWLELAQGFSDAFIVYELKLPYTIERLDLRTNPRIFNDFFRRNRITAFVSTNDKNYQQIYEIKSNGNERFGGLSRGGGRGGDRDIRIDWPGFNEHATYNVLYPNSNQVYVKFNLHSQWELSDAQLISYNRTFVFKAWIDTRSIKKPVIRNGTEIILEKGDNPSEAKIILTLEETGKK